LQRHGWPAVLAEVPGGHTWTTWRDALDPHLTDLLARVWGDPVVSPAGRHGPGR
jgi:S-formylglutathione hydrolase FrmB